MMKHKNLGFVGLGRMGANMARRLKNLGYTIAVVHDLDPSVAQMLAAELQTQATQELTEVTALSDVIFTVVTDDAAMESIFLGPDNLLDGAAGRTFINCATLSPEIHRRIESAAKNAEAACLEACMASSIPQARNGELFLMVGGEKPVYEAVQPILKDLSKSIHYVGQTGRASEVKALVNMVMNINTAALAEGLGLGSALGLDLSMLVEIFRQTGANSRVLETDAQDMIGRDHDCFFSAEHAAKDSGIALSLAKKAGIDLPLARATLAQYQKLIAHGLGHLDKSGVAELTFPGRASAKN